VYEKIYDISRDYLGIDESEEAVMWCRLCSIT